MSQCAIYRLREVGDLVCRVQADLGVETPYILCAPVVLRSDWGALVPKLHLEVAVGDAACVVLMSQLVALPRTELGTVVGDALHRRDDMVAAVDLIVSGF
ncbi:CcdB family protein [Rubrimonas cliftonensis]|uniref:Toxin CcdB n=1 Tax=Rubrimonas cliftonensis TaxID=89524 RepID=A0A1H4GFK1_9RHOB|nr:CcdB family protein [Rubrimonas cliftonensis]SEB07668.1 CcdB protein [Rubrimonas cliftonensis]